LDVDQPCVILGSNNRWLRRTWGEREKRESKGARTYYRERKRASTFPLSVSNPFHLRGGGEGMEGLLEKGEEAGLVAVFVVIILFPLLR